MVGSVIVCRLPCGMNTPTPSSEPVLKRAKLSRDKTVQLTAGQAASGGSGGESGSWGRLTFMRGNELLVRHELTSREVNCGRKCTSSTDIAINHPMVSSHHFRIEIEKSKCFLTDFSSNGTFCKDKKLGKGNRRWAVLQIWAMLRRWAISHDDGQ